LVVSVLGEDGLEVEEGLFTDVLVLVWVLGPLAAPPVAVATPSPRSSNHCGRGLVLALGTSSTAAAIANVDVDVDGDVEGEVAVVLDRDNGLTVGLEAGFVDGVVDASANVGGSKEEAKADDKSSNPVSNPVSVIDALNVAAPVPTPEPEPASTLTPANWVCSGLVGFAGCQDPFEPANMLKMKETDGGSVCAGVRERLVEGRRGFGGGSFVYHPAQFIDRETREENKKTTNE
jgi:hypothetical protein